MVLEIDNYYHQWPVITGDHIVREKLQHWNWEAGVLPAGWDSRGSWCKFGWNDIQLEVRGGLAIESCLPSSQSRSFSMKQMLPRLQFYQPWPNQFLDFQTMQTMQNIFQNNEREGWPLSGAGQAAITFTWSKSCPCFDFYHQLRQELLTLWCANLGPQQKHLTTF